jgi:hypothetical protein
MKKQGIIVIAVLLNCLLFSSCEATKQASRVVTAYDQGTQGRTYIGSASSYNECYELAKQKGCTDSFVYVSATNDCYCK